MLDDLFYEMVRMANTIITTSKCRNLNLQITDVLLEIELISQAAQTDRSIFVLKRSS